MKSDRPNILIITTDQQRWDALSLWGTMGYKTPNLDKLAKEGVCFDRSYCSSPVCTPARVSMITGQYSTRHGAYSIGMAPVSALQGPTLGSILSEAGYATAVIGKTHFVARKIEDQHVAGLSQDAQCPDENFWASFDGPYCGFQHVRHHRHHNGAGIPNAHYRSWLKRKGADLNEIDAVHGAGCPKDGVWNMTPKWTQNAWINEECMEYIDSKNDQPWLVMANYQDPHYPYICPEPYYSNVDMSNVDLGGIVSGGMNGKPPFYQYFIDNKDWRDSKDEAFWDGICVPNITHYDKHPYPEKSIRAYMGMCEMVDDYIGRLLEWLKSTHRFDNTLIIFTSDHGDQLGQHGCWGKGPMAFDDNQRIPGLMHWGAVQKNAIGHVKSYFNHVDILPTCLDAAGLPAQDYVQGISQIPILRGEVELLRDWAIVDHVASFNRDHPELNTINLHQCTYIQNDWKLVVYAHADYGELYDLIKDPKQLKNLWNEKLDKRSEMLLGLARANLLRTGNMPQRIGPC